MSETPIDNLPDEVVVLLRKIATFTTWEALAKAVPEFQSSSWEVDRLSYQKDRLEDQLESDDPNIRGFASVELDNVRRQWNHANAKRDRSELVILRTEADYVKLRQFIERDYPELLPLPSLMPLAETEDDQLARAQHAERILGQVLAKAAAEIPQYVTMDQLALICGFRGKKTIERWLKDKKIPQPDIDGGGGKPHRWIWSKVRGPLAQISGRVLPRIYPTLLGS
jgi:hypothetical protein